MRHTILLAVLLSSSIAFGQTQTVYSGDNSDWWSSFRARSHDSQLKPSSAELDPGNFVVAGVHFTNPPFSESIERIGYAQRIKRGDGPTARRQICYSVKGKPPSFLVFESAEVSEGFYLFSSSKNWQGRKRCTDVPSSDDWKTNTGLRLGLTPAQVQTILGKPDEAHDNRYLYLRQFRQNNVVVTLSIEARFAKSQLTYLAASRKDAI